MNTNVSFIGSGNLAWHLAPALDNTGFAVREVFSPNATHAEALTERLYQATVKYSLDFSSSPSRIFFIAVTDDAIPEVVEDLVLPPDAFLFHTSGSQPLSILGYAGTENIGVFYPLQTFSKSRKVDFKEIPVFIESENNATAKLLGRMGKAISKHVHSISSLDRKVLHVAAVFASNFSNHMLTLARDIAQDQNLSFDYLKPLIAETINKSLSMGPENAQTGPAKRGDLEILDKHMEFLQHNAPVAAIYKIISQHILDYHS
jgi:predicted short-subunit dehydrogenase-like oxidoreductase (DUF2520 family)